jgi:predicted O-methyltransferase YrrM
MENPIPSIRPRQIFKLVEDQFPDQNIEITLTMPPSAIGSLLTLESSLLVALLKITEAKNIFEIGTYNGNTALLIANNTPPDAVVTTLDLPPEDIEMHDASKLDLADADQNDQFLRQIFKTQGAFYVNRASPAIRSKVRLLNENSLTFDPVARGLVGTQDVVFVDGGHDYETIKNDTLKAFQMAKPDSVIIWHDYLSKIHTEVEVYLRDLAVEKKLIGIGSTMLCVCFQGKFASLVDA